MYKFKNKDFIMNVMLHQYWESIPLSYQLSSYIYF